MTDGTLLGPWVRRFLLEHLVAERNLARNTQRSYRDALTLLIPFVADKLHHPVDRLTVINVSADLVRLFLVDLEQSRKCSIVTRNQRLAAIHALARFVGEHSPEHIAWCGQIRSIPFKKANKAVIPYLDKPEMDALLGAPDRQTVQGRRDHALLLFLYNSGARAHEAAQLLISELDLAGCSVNIHGKGGKERQCPLWPSTIEELKPLILNRPPAGRVFLNRCGQPMTRFGIYALIERYVRRIQGQTPSLAKKRLHGRALRSCLSTHRRSLNVLPLSACFWRQRLNPADEVWQIRGHHSPDFLQLDALIEMVELVPSSGNQPPGHFGMRRPEFRGHSLDCLPNY